MISKISGKENKKYELVNDNLHFLGDLYLYITKLMNYLPKKPKIIATIIQHSNIEILREQLAPFFINNFYENILSNDSIENNLIYILTLLLEDEINNLKDINQSEDFLSNSPCDILLQELKNKRDIKAYFKAIILNDIEKLENEYSDRLLKIKIEELIEDNNVQENSDDEYKKHNKYHMEFNTKYILNLDKEELHKLININKDNQIIIDYLNPKFNECKNNSHIFSNIKFLKNLNKYSNSETILNKYQNNFNSILSFIDSILYKINDNIHLLPYSIKCLCKIISLLIKKKFPQIKEVEKCSFIARFFFEKLLIPIMSNPRNEAFINNINQTENMLNNLSLLCQIITKFTSGKFFFSKDERDFTPFNWFFIDKIEKLVNLFLNITNVRLPSFIEKLINKELSEEYEYNYFKENPDEIIYHNSIFFNLEQIKAIISTIDKAIKNNKIDKQNNLFLIKSIEKLSSEQCFQIINKLINEGKKNSEQIPINKSKTKNKDKIINESKEVKVHYFLFTELYINEKYNEIFISQNAEYYQKKDSNSIQNDILTVKDLFYNLLLNYKKLVKTDFDEGKIKNTEMILAELNKLTQSSKFIEEGKIPMGWYIKSLFEYLPKIPKYLTYNDYEKIYNEIEIDLKKAIKGIDFELLSKIKEKLENSRRINAYLEEDQKLLNDIILNEELNYLIKNEFIPVDVKFSYKERKFEINNSNLKEKDWLNSEKIKNYEKSKKLLFCLKIDDFINKFPNLVKYQELQDQDIFQIQADLNSPEIINKYFNLIKLSICKKKSDWMNELFYYKIYDYIMCEIYDKVYPLASYMKDDSIFQSSVRLSWIEPKHFIKINLIFGNFLEDVFKYFKLMDTEKSPRKKILYMNNIYNTLSLLLKFNKLDSYNADIKLPILNYALIKFKFLRIYSVLEFMKLYIDEKKNKSEAAQLNRLLSLIDSIPEIKSDHLIGVDKEEFIKKCMGAIEI